METLNCTNCHGAGETEHWRKDGTMRVCSCCDGRGTFESPDLKQLCEAIRGRKPRTVRSKRPEDPRAFFLWRMTRFHSGADVTLPVVATMDVDGDPFKPVLEIAAQMIAEHCTGKQSIGSARWRHAIHGEMPADPAVLDMPIFDSDKPMIERMEVQ